jgi:hypothetical protein
MDACGDIQDVYRYPDGGVVLRRFGKKFCNCCETKEGWTWSAPNGKWLPYKSDAITDKPSVVVVEGEKDANTLWRLGIPAVTSRSGSKSPGRTDWSPLAGKRVVIWPDNDEPGAAYAASVKALLMELETPPCVLGIVDVASLGEGKMDATEYVKLHGDQAKDEVRRVLRAAVSQGPMSGLWNRLRQVADGKRRNLTSPWPNLDKYARCWQPEGVVILCADPGVGKSFFGLTLAMGLHRSGVVTATLCVEESHDWHMHRALAILAGNGDFLNLDWLEHNVEAAEAVAREHHDWLEDFGKTIYTPDLENQTYGHAISWMRARARSARLLIIDALSTLDKQGEPVYKLDPWFMREAKRSAEDHGCTILVITHPAKDQSHRKRPMMDDMSGGAAVERCCSTVLWMRRVDDEAARHNREMFLLKTRTGPGRYAPIRMHLGPDVNLKETDVVPSI